MANSERYWGGPDRLISLCRRNHPRVFRFDGGHAKEWADSTFVRGILSYLRQ